MARAATSAALFVAFMLALAPRVAPYAPAASAPRASASSRRCRTHRRGASRARATTRDDDDDANDDDDDGKPSVSRSIDALSSILGESADDDVEPEGVARASPSPARVPAPAPAAATPVAQEDEDEAPASREWRDFVSLLVAVGGVKGTLAVVVAALCGVSAFGDVSSTTFGDVAIGLALAAPTTGLDAFAMGVDWTAKAEAAEAKRAAAAAAADGGDGDGAAMQTRNTPKGGVLDDYIEPLARYQIEETMANPCKSQPWWMDVSVAATARVADEMLERAVVLSIGAKWIADRAVEAGVEPYDAETPSKIAVVAVACAVLEFRLRRARKASRVQAFRVERNKVTGKQTLVPVSDDEMNADDDDGGAWKGFGAWFSGDEKKEKTMKDAKATASATRAEKDKPSSKSELKAFRNLVRGKTLKDTLDGSRSRLLLLTQSIAFVSTGSIVAPVVGGFAADVLYIAHQRRAMTRFIERALGEKPNGAPKDDIIRKAQAASIKAMLHRKKKRMSREVVDAMSRDPSITRDVNILFQDVVRRTKRVKNVDETTALDEVLLHVNKAAPQGAEDESTEDGAPTYVEKMTAALRELDAALDELERGADTNDANDGEQTPLDQSSTSSGDDDA